MVIGSSSPARAAGSAPPTTSARSAGIRLAALFGPAIFGVTAAGVALPDVAIAMDAQLSAAAWVLTAHALALGAGTALFGRLSDSRGVRLSLIIGSVVLATGAVVCVVAPSLDVLVAGRFILAAGSGAMSSSALVLAAAAEPAHRPRILAIVGAGMALFSAGSVLAGGVVTDWISWRVTLVLPALSLFAVPFSLREAAARPGSGRPVDFPGAAMLTAAAAAALMLIQASSLDLGVAAVTMTALLLIFATAGLVLWISRRPSGFVPRALATDGTFLRAALIGAGVYAGLFGAMYAVPQALAQEHGWSVLVIGVWLLPGAVLGGVLSRVASRFAAGAGGPRLVVVTAAAAAILLGTVALADGGSVMLVAGTSLGFAAFAVTQVVMIALMSTRIPVAGRGGAVALLNLAFFVGGGIGAAVAGTLAASVDLTSVLGFIGIFPLLAAGLALRDARVAR